MQLKIMKDNPTLTVLSGKLKGTVIDLILESYTFGRNADCEIVFSDSTVSGRHCKMEKNQDGSFRLLDLGSTNGMFVNTIQTTSQNLMNGDIVKLGLVEMLYNAKDSEIYKTDKTKYKSSGNIEETKVNLLNTIHTGLIEEMENISPFAKDNCSKGKNLPTKLITLLIILLIIIIVVLLAVLLLII